MRDYAEIDRCLAPLVRSGELAGAATLVWRGGTVEYANTFGLRDLATRSQLVPGTIFRIASMSKPITTVAALMLLDDGRYEIDAPITAVAPELAEMRVLRNADGPLDQTEPARRPITFRDLLTHRSGLTYGDFHRGPIAQACEKSLGPQIDNALTPDEWIARLATLPLIDQPGENFHYGISTDLLGFLIARLDNAPLGDVLARRVFEPLGMIDTGFSVAAAKRHRRAGLCGFDRDGKPSAIEAAPGSHAVAERPLAMSFESGGQGLWSTPEDYLRFAQLFLADGRPLLKPATFRMMVTNQLTPAQRGSARMLGRPLFASGHGYGMGVAIVMEPDRADPMRCRGAAGTVGWPGAYGSWWQADPADGAVLIFMAHNMVTLEQLMSGVGLGAWGAVAAFHAAAA